MVAGPRVELVDVDERVLALLVEAATTDATADEVTPPITDGCAWTPERTSWLREFHRCRRAGLAGPAGEATWAVLVDGAVSGQIRLKRLTPDGVAEIGLWLRRGVRGRGVGTQVVAATLPSAAAAGFRVIHAETTTSNVGARRLLERCGFELSRRRRRGITAVLGLPGDGDPVTASGRWRGSPSGTWR